MTKCIKFWGAPGTGKTTRLIQEINSLLDKGYEKEEFIVTTFRKVMADEIRNRLQWGKEGNVSTLHAACRKFAGIDGKVVKDKEMADFCKAVGLAFDGRNSSEEYDFDSISSGNNRSGNLFFDTWHYLQNNLLEISQLPLCPDYMTLEKHVPHPEIFITSYSEKYRQWKENYGYVDYDDMLMSAYRGKIVPPARILVVDEFQDLTPLQYAIIRFWETNMDYVLIAGDPRQCVYSFWGASADFFEKHDGEQVTLKKSYRLPAPIWKFATAILDQAGLSYPIIETSGKPGLVEKIIESVYYERMGAPAFLSNTKHLVRTNQKGVTVAHALASAGVPFVGIAGWKKKQIDFYNAIIKVRRAMAGESAVLSADELEEIIDAYPAKHFALKKTKLRERLEHTKQFKFEDIKHWAMLDIYGKRALWHIIASDAVLSETLKEYQDPESLKHNKIIRALKKNGKQIDNITVAVSTIHSAKGSEAHHVFLHDSITRRIWTKLYPHPDWVARAEEAQLFYVGASRALQFLFIVEGKGKYRYALSSIKEGVS